MSRRLGRLAISRPLVVGASLTPLGLERAPRQRASISSRPWQGRGVGYKEDPIGLGYEAVSAITGARLRCLDNVLASCCLEFRGSKLEVISTQMRVVSVLKCGWALDFV